MNGFWATANALAHAAEQYWSGLDRAERVLVMIAITAILGFLALKENSDDHEAGLIVWGALGLLSLIYAGAMVFGMI